MLREPPHHRPAGGGAGLRRLLGAAVAAGSAALLALAAWLEPSAAGLGTHSQLGMPACGWIAVADLPCPTCGMTTAFAHAADGRLATAVATQPAGGLLAVAIAALLPLGAYVAVTGSRVAALLGTLRVGFTAWALGLAAGAAWIYKILAYKGWLG